MEQSSLCSRPLWTALYLCLFELGQPQPALRVLGLVLARSRSRAPLAMQFTFAAMQPGPPGLLLLRFVSQLGDSLSRGSLRDSLDGQLSHPDLICELRHCLTHKEEPETGLVLRATRLLQEEVRLKYWRHNYMALQAGLDWH
jgi:hypothetical protein